MRISLPVQKLIESSWILKFRGIFSFGENYYGITFAEHNMLSDNWLISVTLNLYKFA